MKLTQKQEALITRFLRDAGDQLGEGTPPAARERVLRGLHQRITTQLRSVDKEVAADADVLAILARAAAATAASAPLTQEAPLTPAGRMGDVPQFSKASLEQGPKAVWLGVCAHNADRFGLPVWMLRLLFVLFGITGPLAIVTYIILYGERYLQLPVEERPPLQYGPLIWRPVLALAVAIALNKGAQYAVLAGFKTYEAYLNRTAPLLGDWGWIQVHGPSLFVLTLVIALPFSVLSALPLANAWDYSLKRLVQATLALYGVLLAFGLASAIVGLILDAVHNFAGR